VGHTFNCKRCGTSLVVLADGIHVSGGSAPQAFPQDNDFAAAPSRRPSRRPSAFMDFLLFRRMIVPIFIQRGFPRKENNQPFCACWFV
jgi:hypothetical protein